MTDMLGASAMPAELIDPPTIEDMDQGEIETFLEGIRDRRMVVARVLSKATHRARETKSVDLAVSLEKKIARLRKSVDKLDDLIIRCETLANEVIALRLQHRDISAAGLVAEMRMEVE